MPLLVPEMALADYPLVHIHIQLSGLCVLRDSQTCLPAKSHWRGSVIRVIPGCSNYPGSPYIPGNSRLFIVIAPSADQPHGMWLCPALEILLLVGMAVVRSTSPCLPWRYQLLETWQ